MTEFQAALGLVQMKKVDRIIAARRRLAATYDELLGDIPIQAPAVGPESQHVYQSYVTLLRENAAARGEDLIRHLKNHGIETAIGTWHMPMTTYFCTRYGYKVGDFPVSDWVFQKSVALPLYEGLQETEQSVVVRQLVVALGEEELGRNV